MSEKNFKDKNHLIQGSQKILNLKTKLFFHCSNTYINIKKNIIHRLITNAFYMTWLNNKPVNTYISRSFINSQVTIKLNILIF